ncbi:MAG TPA: hypothetical protein VFM29_08790 [Vicinamibacteria bacterium]|nr:hypothetical protein [Vicinamibacteria bacterium]
MTRLAISPWRILLEGGAQTDVRVRVRPGWDEVVCLDRNTDYRLDIQGTQKNADGRECCYEGTFIWRKTDNSNLVVAESPRTPEGSIYRYNISPRGREGLITVQAELDRVLSHPWQSGAGYAQEPLRIEVMSANQLSRECNCIYRGNGVYEGGGCPKAP